MSLAVGPPTREKKKDREEYNRSKNISHLLIVNRASDIGNMCSRMFFGIMCSWLLGMIT